MKKLFTTPKVVRSTNGDWFVFFRYWDAKSGKYKAFKLRNGLNRIENLGERDAEFNALAAARLLWLEYGWNPITNVIPAPAIHSFSPTTAFTGDTVEITGENLHCALQVYFGDAPAQSFKVENANKITAIVGKGESGRVGVDSIFFPALLPGFIFTSDPSAPNIDLAELGQMTIPQALQYGFDARIKDWSKKTIGDYKSMLKYTVMAAHEAKITNLSITSAKAMHFRLLLDKVVAVRKLGNAGFNKYRDFISGLISVLSKDEIIPVNPVSKIDYKKELITKAYKEPTEEECRIIIPRIKAVNWPYYRFLAVCYGCAMRPKEVTRLRVKDFHKKDQIFRLDPRQDGGSKTMQFRNVTIPDWLMTLLSELNLHVYKPDDYIFSGGRGLAPFTPGPCRLNNNHPTTVWRDIVKNGLKIDVDQYGLKKRAGTIMVRLMHEKGIDQLIKMPQMQMGHANPEMTAIYTQEHERIMREVIKREMPSL